MGLAWYTLKACNFKNLKLPSGLGRFSPRVQICIENCIPEMPLSQLVQIIGRNKFSIRFESLCWILRVSPQTRMSQNQAKSNYKDSSFGNRDSSVKGTRLSISIFAKSQAGWKLEVLEVASLVNILIE